MRRAPTALMPQFERDLVVVVDGVLPPTVFGGLRFCGAVKLWNVH